MPRRLIVCSDGTWSTPDMPAPTNVVKINDAIVQEPAAPQIVFYDEGVGGFWGGLFGFGLSQNVRDAYRFLVETYRDGDDVFFFGYSRGAFTVRSCAAFIRKCWLLPPEHVDRIDDAFRIYRSKGDSPDTPEALQFRDRYHCREPKITFIGVWDTVGSLGVPYVPIPFIGERRFQFHDQRLSDKIAFAYQALAIDEKRGSFEPTLWEQDAAPGQTIQQAWFAGAHENVGGGIPETGLSNATLLWMMEKAAGAGLVLHSDALTAAAANADPLGPLHDSRKFPWSLLPAHVRTIGEHANECVHPDVSQRYDSGARPPYRPTNLGADQLARLCD